MYQCVKNVFIKGLGYHSSMIENPKTLQFCVCIPLGIDIWLVCMKSIDSELKTLINVNKLVIEVVIDDSLI